jgi:hypothetical protein
VLERETVINTIQGRYVSDGQSISDAHRLDVIGVYCSAMERALATSSSGATPTVYAGTRWRNGKKRLRMLSKRAMRLSGVLLSACIAFASCKKNLQLLEAFFLVDFLFGRSLAVRSAFFPETAFLGELP